MNERRIYVNFVRYLTLKRENLQRAKNNVFESFWNQRGMSNNTSTIFEVGTIFWDLTLSNNNMNSTLSTIATGLSMRNITSFSCCSVLFHRCSQLLLLPLGIPNRYYLYFTTVQIVFHQLVTEKRHHRNFQSWVSIIIYSARITLGTTLTLGDLNAGWWRWSQEPVLRRNFRQSLHYTLGQVVMGR